MQREPIKAEFREETKLPQAIVPPTGVMPTHEAHFSPLHSKKWEECRTRSLSELWANRTKKSNGGAHTSILTTFRLILKRDMKADSKPADNTAGCVPSTVAMRVLSSNS